MIIADKLQVVIEGKEILHSLSVQFQQGKITSIIGPNGSGKSTLLKTVTRSLSPSQGTILINGSDLRTMKAKQLAKQVAVLYQSSKAPNDVTVKDLVQYGRFPYQTWWRSNTEEDLVIVEWALQETGLEQLADRPVITLSGGEQQRAWIAMALAQQPQILLLDEPTTYLDIAHQLEVLELVKQLNSEKKLTVIMVLHDFNHAAKYSDSIVVLNQGNIAASGSPSEVLTAAMFRQVFKVEIDLWYDQDHRPVFSARGLINKKTPENIRG